MSFFITFGLFVVFYAGGDNLFQLVLGNEEALDRKQTCDADNADDVAHRIGVLDDNVSCDSKGENLDGVRRGKIDKHAHELKSDYNRQNMMKDMCRIGEISLDGEHTDYLLN